MKLTDHTNSGKDDLWDEFNESISCPE